MVKVLKGVSVGNDRRLGSRGWVLSGLETEVGCYVHTFITFRASFTTFISLQMQFMCSLHSINLRTKYYRIKVDTCAFGLLRGDSGVFCSLPLLLYYVRTLNKLAHLKPVL